MSTFTAANGVTYKQYVRRIYGEDIDFVYYDGCAIRNRHLDSMLTAALYTPGWGRLNLTQGGLSSSVAASAKTHALLDVADISVRGKSKLLVWSFCRNLFENGNLPFPRGYVKDSFQNNKHIHTLFAPATFGHSQLQGQYWEWKNYLGDGLVGPSPYTGPSEKVGRWADSMFNPANRTNLAFSGVTTAENGLLGLDRYRRVKLSRKKGYKLNFVAKVNRWGRLNYVTKYETFYAASYIDLSPETRK